MTETTKPSVTGPNDAIEHVRTFNRHWTEVLGLLDRHFLATDLSLTEGRVIYELSHRDRWEQLALRHRLDIDASFLTRVVGRLTDKGLVAARPSPTDGRAVELSLTDAGRAVADDLAQRSRDQIAGLLEPLTDEQRHTVVEAMTIVTNLIRPDGDTPPDRTVTLREPRPGDLGWIVERHGAIYADEFAWSGEFEALAAEIVADFDRTHDPERERIWIAEVDGARAGCALCRQRTPDEAQLRLVLVERWARGLGIGRRLVDDCIAFARDAGYETLMLWTNDVLVSARRIYEAAGFRLVEEEPHDSFGQTLVGQNWRLAL